MNKKILIVEDEPNLGLTLKEYLESLKYQTELSTTVSKARDSYKVFKPDLILMDINLPDGSGVELAKELKKEANNLPLIFLSAMNDPDIRVEGFEVGALDYITKPFALKELTHRLNNAFSLSNQAKDLSEIHHGPLAINFKAYQLIDANQQVIHLSQKECSILKALYENHGAVVSREEIIEKIWGENQYPSNRTVDNYIVKLRKWCESDPQENIKIQSIRGVGYKLTIQS